MVKGVEEQVKEEEDEAEVDCRPTSQEREDVSDDSTSTAESDDEEWDESLLHPLQ